MTLNASSYTKDIHVYNQLNGYFPWLLVMGKIESIRQAKSNRIDLTRESNTGIFDMVVIEYIYIYIAGK